MAPELIAESVCPGCGSRAVNVSHCGVVRCDWCGKTKAAHAADYVPYDWMPKNDADRHEIVCRYSGLGRHYTGSPDDCCCLPPAHIDGSSDA